MIRLKIKLTLPYPPSELLPNRHTHWSVKAKATRKARKDAYYEARNQAHSESFATALPEPMESVALDITFYPPKGRVADMDGLYAAFKPCLDSLVDAKIIKDDSPKVIKLVNLHVGSKSDNPRTEITVSELDNILPSSYT